MKGALKTGKLNIPAAPPDCPPWAGGFGVDKHGVFADFIWRDAIQRMRWITPGLPFMMGSLDNELGEFEDEKPRHQVTIEQGYWLGDTPITQGFYEAVTKSNPSDFKGDQQRPVDSVTWHESKAFCHELSAALPDSEAWQARLPSEAEWEYACRAGTEGPLYSGRPLTSEHGRCFNLDDLAWYDQSSGSKTNPVKGKAANPWGLYDMLGNVWEWCEDHWHDDYKGAPEDGRAWVDDDAKEGRGRVIRGGGWDGDARWCRAAVRGGDGPGFRVRNQGFRLVLAPSSIASLERER